MQKKPDIVNILREEERQGLLHSTSQKNTRDNHLQTEDIFDSSQQTLMICKKDTPCIKNITPAQLIFVYQTVFQKTQIPILVFDIDQRILLANHAAELLLGKNNKELINTSASKLYSKEEWSTFQQLITKNNKEQNQFTTSIQTKHNTTLTVTVDSIGIQDNTGKTFGFIHFIHDNQQQQKSSYDPCAVIEYADDSIYILDKQARYVMVNNQLLNRLGCSREQIIGKTFQEFHSEAETKDFYHKLNQVFTQSKPIKDEHQRKGKWFLRTLSPLKDRLTENTTAVLVVSKDITENKATIHALSESEKKFRNVLENSLDMIYQLNLSKEQYDYVSPSSERIYGHSTEEILTFTPQQIETIIHPDDRDKWTEHLKAITECKKQNSMQSIEYRIKHKTLGYRWIRDTFAFIFNEKQESNFIIGSIEDITEQKKIWDEIVKSEQKYRILAETSADGVFTTDALGRLTYINPAFEKLCSRRKSQILATPFRNYLLEDSIYFFQQIIIDVRKKNQKMENVELEIVTGDGNIIPIEVNIAPLQKDSEFNGVVCTVRDIIQRREVEAELKKNERLKTEFMNIAAHELRSPVTPIKGYLDLIIHDTECNDKIKNWAKISLRNAERLLRLVNDILDVARLDSDTMRFEMEKINLADLLYEIAEDMKPAITNKKLDFNLNISKTLPHIIGDKIRLSQVLKNLIGNAIKFTDVGFIELIAEKQDNHIRITVGDSGIGISEDELRKIFTKFYQAYTGVDRNNEGTGLGLFISKEIIKKHNGIIWAESKLNKGSQFIIQLPFIHKMIVDFQK